MGRKKIEMKRIENPRARLVCFSKRRKTLFKKAAELSRLYNVEISAVVFSPAGKPFVCGNPSLLFSTATASASASKTVSRRSIMDTGKKDCLIFDDISDLSLPQLKEYSVSLEKMRADLIKNLEEEKGSSSSSSSSLMNDVYLGFESVISDNYSTEIAVDSRTFQEDEMIVGYNWNCNDLYGQLIGEDLITSKSYWEDSSMAVPTMIDAVDGDQGFELNDGFIEGEEMVFTVKDESWMEEMMAHDGKIVDICYRDFTEDLLYTV